MLHGLVHSERLQEAGRLDMSSQLPTVSLSAVSGRNRSTPGGLVQSPAVTHHVPGQCGVRGWQGGHVQTSLSFRLKRLRRQNERPPAHPLCAMCQAQREGETPSSWLQREAECLQIPGHTRLSCLRGRDSREDVWARAASKPAQFLAEQILTKEITFAYKMYSISDCIWKQTGRRINLTFFPSKKRNLTDCDHPWCSNHKEETDFLFRLYLK